MKRGFTLVEVIVALTIAGLIALAARAAVVGGLDTQERLTRHTTASENELRFRNLLVLALRHIVDAPVPNQPPFVVRDTMHNGVQSQVAEFYSRGFGHPAGTGPIVNVRIAPTADGLTLTAMLADAPLFTGQLTSAVAMQLRARMPSGEWVALWPRTLQLPTALEVNFTAAPGAGVPLPLFVSARLEERP
jgi:prepilin-type N-terminal cleavage/methylation domain-containing protein